MNNKRMEKWPLCGNFKEYHHRFEVSCAGAAINSQTHALAACKGKHRQISETVDVREPTGRIET